MTGLAIWNARNATPMARTQRNTIRHATQRHSARNANKFIVQTVGKVLIKIIAVR